MAEELNYKEVPEKFADEKELGLISRVSPEQEPRQETGGQQDDPEAERPSHGERGRVPEHR